MSYTQDQRAWLIENYFTTQNARETARLFGQSFNCPPPDHRTVLSLIEKFRNIESGQNLLKPRDPPVLTPYKLGEIQLHFHQNPNTSIRQAAAVFHISNGSVHSALRSMGLYPYKAINVQQLIDGDNLRRLEFSHAFAWACGEMERRGANFHDHIFWTDETGLWIHSDIQIAVTTQFEYRNGYLNHNHK